MGKRVLSVMCVVVLTVLAQACSHTSSSAGKDVRLAGKKGGRKVTQAELQQDVQRFSSELTADLVDAMTPLRQSPDPAVRNAATRQLLVYGSSALEIATEPMPEVSLLDMMVFVALSRDTLETYWVPKVYGDVGKPVLAAMTNGQQRLWVIAQKVMSPEQENMVLATVRAWRQQNPKLVAVESVRFTDFSIAAGRISQEEAANTGGLMSTVKAVTQTADQALLLGERAVFLAHRMPFLLRLQAAVGTHEVLGDLDAQLATAQEVMEDANDMRPLIQDLVTLVEKSMGAVEQTHDLVDAVTPFLPQRAPGETETQYQGLIEQANELARRSQRILTQLESLAPGGDQDLAARLDHLARRWTILGLLAGVLLIVLFWTGYYVARRADGRRTRVMRDERSAPRDDGRPPVH
jgi:hypothetical protein